MKWTPLSSRFQIMQIKAAWKHLMQMKAAWKQLSWNESGLKATRKQLESGFNTEMGVAWKRHGSSLEAAFILRAASKPLPGLLEPLSFWERLTSRLQAAPKSFCHGTLSISPYKFTISLIGCCKIALLHGSEWIIQFNDAYLREQSTKRVFSKKHSQLDMN